MSDKAFQYRTMITSQHKLLDLHVGETYKYRDLIYLFVKRDFTAKYKQTILGPLWAVIQPLLTTVVFTIIFGRLAKLTTADAPGNLMIPGSDDSGVFVLYGGQYLLGIFCCDSK